MATKPEDKFVTVDGLKLRYIEEGSGPSVLFLHGASLGSSADVFRRNLGPFAQAGFRAVAFDYPGFGLSDVPGKAKHGAATQFDSEIHRCRGPRQDRADRPFTLRRLCHSAGIGRAQPLFACDHSGHRLAAAAADRSPGRQVRSGAGARRQGDGGERNRHWKMLANSYRPTPSIIL